MSFAWKMILAVSLLLALSLSLGGAAVVDRAFRTELDAACRNAEEDMQLFGMTLEALCLNRPVSDTAYEAGEMVRKLVEDSQALSHYEYAVLNPAGIPVVETPGIVTGGIEPGELGVIRVGVATVEDRRHVVAVEKVMLAGESFVLIRSTDISELFQRTGNNLRTYRIVMFVVLLLGIAVTTGFTLYFTSPLRNLSRAAHRLSEGQYSRRVTVKSRDELGKLAGDFNSMAESLENTIRELEDAAAREKDFTASFAHELKTPLTSVIGYADMLRSREVSPERRQEASEYIFREGKRLETMSHALLALFALENEKPEMKRIRFRRLAGEIVSSASYAYAESGVVLYTDADEAIVTGEPDLLKTLILNLLDNARKASTRDGKVLLAGKSREEGFVVSVTDLGRGIPPEALKRITEPFYMVDKSRAREQGGAGLGLALSKKIAELHGTELTFESEPGKGTRVSFVLREERREEE
ncbi:MAG: HAMP domain-containing histidine kinase [Clostridia bacterium]|nr:HAMP domain-containing histidine kinase [Clostridia bacterium]